MNNQLFYRVAVLFGCLAMHPPCMAAVGAVFPIAEPDARSFIQAKARNLNLSKKVRMAARWRNLMKGEFSLSAATQDRTLQYAPIYTVDRTIFGSHGQIIAHRGDQINLLKKGLPFNRLLVFYNDNDVKQIEIVKQYLEKTPVKPAFWRIILTSGKIKSASKRWQRRIYFDQKNKLTTKLGIEHVPAFVQREGDHLKIEEISGVSHA